MTFQLGSAHQFASYFSFSNRQGVESLTFSVTNPEHTTDPLKIPMRIIYLKEAAPGDYETRMSVTVTSREEVGLTPREDIQISTVAFTVTEGMYLHVVIYYI